MKDKKQGLSLKSINSAMEESNQVVDDRLESVETELSEMNSNIGEVLKAVQALSAKNYPTSIAKEGIDSRDAYKKLDVVDIEFKKGNPNDDVEIERPGITSVSSSEFVDKADQMRFDTQLLEIMVMASNNSYPDHTFTVGVNGIHRLIVRGKKQMLPRNYVEVLLRAKTSFYGNDEFVNNRGEKEVRHPETKSHRYPLNIIRDPAGVAGGAWLERVSNDMRA